MLTPAPRRIYHPTRIIIGVAAVVVLVSGIAAAYLVYSIADQSGRAHILDRAATVAIAIPKTELAELSGTDADLTLPAYQTLKTFLEEVRSVNSDVRFVYLIGKNQEGNLFFYADSESVDSPESSPPGQIYDEATPAMFAVFTDGASRTEGPAQDRWGIWISGYAPVRDGTGNIVAMLGMDLPATRYLIDAIAYASLPVLLMLVLLTVLAAIERSRRNELAYVAQKAEFLSIASHEIRTPLTGIRWAIEGLLSRKNLNIDASAHALLALVHESSIGLIGRVNNLLDLTALEGRKTSSLNREEIDIPAFVEDLVEGLTLSARQRNVTVVLDPSVRAAGALVADRQMLHHAFFNLLTNAIKYTNPDTEVRVLYEKRNKKHLFRVRDQGKGIAPEDRKRIFEGYQRTKDAIRSGQYGTGLGLFLVRKAAELHGGTITITDEGPGATFLLTIPEVSS